jgi:hypothetical protein
MIYELVRIGKEAVVAYSKLHALLELASRGLGKPQKSSVRTIGVSPRFEPITFLIRDWHLTYT